MNIGIDKINTLFMNFRSDILDIYKTKNENIKIFEMVTYLYPDGNILQYLQNNNKTLQN